MVLAPLQSGLASWGVLLALLAGPGLVATVLWSCVLASGRLRSLFRRLPLTRSAVGNYVLVSMGLSVPWLVGLGWAFSVIGGRPEREATGEPLFAVAVGLGLMYVVGLPIVAGFVLPRLGVDWDESGYGPGTWLLLFSGGTWYAAIFAAPTFLFGLVVSLPF